MLLLGMLIVAERPLYYFEGIALNADLSVLELDSQAKISVLRKAFGILVLAGRSLVPVMLPVLSCAL